MISKRSLLSLFGLSLLIIGVVVTVFLSQKHQEIRSHAAAPTAGQGVYDSCGPGDASCQAHFSIFARDGLKEVINYSQLYGTTQDEINYANAAAAQGMKVIWSLASNETKNLCTFYSVLASGFPHCTNNNDFIAQFVALTKNNPGTWGYYIDDEGGVGAHSTIRSVYQTIKAQTNLPVLIVEAYWTTSAIWSNLPTLCDSADVLGIDYYPIGMGNDINRTGSLASAVNSVAHNCGKQPAIVLQAHSWSEYGYPGAPYPNTAQMLSMLQQTTYNMDPSVVLWYSYFSNLGGINPNWANLIPVIQSTLPACSNSNNPGGFCYPTNSSGPTCEGGTYSGAFCASGQTCCKANPGPPIGNFDVARTDSFAGWACQDVLGTWTSPTRVDLYADGPWTTGKYIGSTTANTSREQAVANLCGGNANHGFSVDPHTLEHGNIVTDGNTHTIYAYGINAFGGTNPQLGNSIQMTVISPPTNTPTPTQQPTSVPTQQPTSVPTQQPTSVPPTISPPTDTPVSNPTYVIFHLALPGIGINENNSPIHPHRNARVDFLDSKQAVLEQDSVTFTYDTQGGLFATKVPFQNSAQSVAYIELNLQDALTYTYPVKTPLLPNQENILPTFPLITGDINADGQISIVDYSILLSCFHNTCSKDLYQQADLDDDGIVDGVDYNIWLRAFLQQQ